VDLDSTPPLYKLIKKVGFEPTIPALECGTTVAIVLSNYNAAVLYQFYILRQGNKKEIKVN
jgi:hypothetical protein